MAFGHLVSIPRTRTTSIATGGNCLKSKKFVDNYSANSISTRASWQPNRNLITKEYSLKHNISKNHFKAIEGGISSTSDDKIQKTYLVNASSAQSHESEPQALHESQNSFNTIKKALLNAIKFSRFYGFIPKLVGSLSASILAANNFSEISSMLFIKGFLQLIVPYFFLSQYIMGVNQLADIEIDKINKPYLPLASGDYSYKYALIIVASYLFMSIGLSWMAGSKPLFWSVIVSVVLMSAYSVNLPLLRWKRSIILTTLSCAISLLASFNIGPFLHMQGGRRRRKSHRSQPLLPPDRDAQRRRKSNGSGNGGKKIKKTKWQRAKKKISLSQPPPPPDRDGRTKKKKQHNVGGSKKMKKTKWRRRPRSFEEEEEDKDAVTSDKSAGVLRETKRKLRWTQTFDGDAKTQICDT